MDILSFIGGNKIVFIKNAVSNLPSWHDFEKLFDSAIDNIIWQSFATMGIDKSEKYTDAFNGLIDIASSMHPGKMASVLSIIHFENSENNNIPLKASSLYEKFSANNPDKKPLDFSPLWMTPTIHDDPVDGIFIQCEGRTLWTAYYKDEEESWIAEPGDLLYIPKKVTHSVKTLEPRAAISIGFTDN